MARVLETRYPQLQERISSVLELLSMGDAAALIGSQQLIDLLAREARLDLARFSPRQEFRSDSQRPALIAAGAVLLILLILLLIWPRQTTLLLKRAVAPHRSTTTCTPPTLSSPNTRLGGARSPCGCTFRSITATVP